VRAAANQSLNLTEAAITVVPGFKLTQTAPAGELSIRRGCSFSSGLRSAAAHFAASTIANRDLL
jgi:hypothetical protein